MPSAFTGTGAVFLDADAIAAPGGFFTVFLLAGVVMVLTSGVSGTFLVFFSGVNGGVVVGDAADFLLADAAADADADVDAAVAAGLEADADVDTELDLPRVLGADVSRTMPLSSGAALATFFGGRPLFLVMTSADMMLQLSSGSTWICIHAHSGMRSIRRV